METASLLGRGYAGGGATSIEESRIGVLSAAQLDALRVEASAVDLPERGATFDAAAWMPDGMREPYEQPSTLEVQPLKQRLVEDAKATKTTERDEGELLLPSEAHFCDQELAAPRPKRAASRKFRMSAREEKKLCARLDTAGMLTPVPEDEAKEPAQVRRGAGGCG